jgi:hypothetical protein
MMPPGAGATAVPRRLTDDPPRLTLDAGARVGVRDLVSLPPPDWDGPGRTDPPSDPPPDDVEPVEPPPDEPDPDDEPPPAGRGTAWA